MNDDFNSGFKGIAPKNGTSSSYYQGIDDRIEFDKRMDYLSKPSTSSNTKTAKSGCGYGALVVRPYYRCRRSDLLGLTLVSTLAALTIGYTGVVIAICSGVEVDFKLVAAAVSGPFCIAGVGKAFLKWSAYEMDRQAKKKNASQSVGAQEEIIAARKVANKKIRRKKIIKTGLRLALWGVSIGVGIICTLHGAMIALAKEVPTDFKKATSEITKPNAKSIMNAQLRSVTVPVRNAFKSDVSVIEIKDYKKPTRTSALTARVGPATFTPASLVA